MNSIQLIVNHIIVCIFYIKNPVGTFAKKAVFLRNHCIHKKIAATKNGLDSAFNEPKPFFY